MEEERSIKGYERNIKSFERDIKSHEQNIKLPGRQEKEQDKQYVLLSKGKTSRNEKISNKINSDVSRSNYSTSENKSSININAEDKKASEYASDDKYNIPDKKQYNGITFDDARTKPISQLVKEELRERYKERKEQKSNRGIYVSGKKREKTKSFGESKFVKKTVGSIKSVAQKGVNKVTDAVMDNTIDFKEASSSEELESRKERKKAVSLIVYIAVKMVGLATTITMNVLGIIGIVAVAVLAVFLIISVGARNATYDFIVDEQRFIREYVSQINIEFTQEMKNKAAESGCVKTVMYGELSDWKEIIAFWWTVKSKESKTDKWNDFFSGNDIEDLRRLFYEFNKVSTDVKKDTKSASDEAENKYFKISIKNKSLDEMVTEWKLSESQKIYLDDLLADEDIWKSIFGSSVLCQIALRETGATSSKYRKWYPLDSETSWNLAFVEYCLDKAGYISENKFKKTLDAEEFYNMLISNSKYAKLSDEPKEGEIVFLEFKENPLKAGIITKADKDYVEIMIGDHAGKDNVNIITVGRDASSIKAYVELILPEVAFDEKRSSGVTYAGQYVWPAVDNYIVTSCFGPRWGTNHNGMDIACPEGTPIVAIDAGKVTISQYSDSAGNFIMINHGDITSVYMHNSQLVVEVGQEVKAGDVIAYSGNTGNSTGPHSHVGIYKDDKYVNPAPYFGLPEDFEGDCSDIIKNRGSELNLLAATLATEGRSDNYESMLAVGTVIMNRIESEAYPDTIKDVIYQPRQFEVTWASPLFREYVSDGAPDLAFEVAQDLLNANKRTEVLMDHNCTQFRTDMPQYRSSFPNGISIGGNWFFW